jgi:tetratricopeptide (TPR) repeat protein
MLVEAGMLRQAQATYEAILEHDPKHGAALAGLGRLLFDQRQFGKASDVFGRALRGNPRDFAVNYLLGASLFNRGLADSAFAFLAVAQTLNPYYVPAIAMLALIQFNRENFGEAARLYRNALGQQSDHADLWYRAGLCYYHLQELAEAKRCFSQASRLDSANSTYFAHLGLVWYELKQFDSARVAFESAVRFDEENPTLYLNLGLALAHLDSVGPAVAALQKAVVAYGPKDIARVYNEMGALYFSKERYRDALAAYQKALSVDPRNRTAAFNLAITLDQLGDYKRAAGSYRRYVAIAAEDSTQRRNVSVAKERLKLLPR